MLLQIDTDNALLTTGDGKGGEVQLPLYSPEAFELISDVWVKVGWNEKYSYTFSWMGRPLIQLPEDVLRIQEAIHEIGPDVVVETGVAHGGSLVLYASIFEAMGKGKVIGVDIEIRPHNRAAIEAHRMFPRIDLIEGDSASDEIVADVASRIPEGSTVLVILDSNHSRDHVRAELDAYAGLVSKGSYIVATDGIMGAVSDVPRGEPGWDIDNPVTAVTQFLEQNPDFVLETPAWPFNESELSKNITHWPSAWLKKIR